MAVEYAKKTNAELIEILKSRSLPHTGKKADLVARLQEADRSDANKAVAAAPAKSTAVEDVIDWDDDAPLAEPAVPTKPSTSTATAAPIKQVPNPTAVPSQKVDIDPSTTHDLKVVRSESKAGTASTAAPGDKATPSEQINGADVKPEEKPAVDYSIGLSATDLEVELAKRKARAEKFGIVEDSSTALEQAKKAVERAKRFGTVTEDAAIVKGLDEALPERTKKRERGNDAGGNSRGGKRRDFRRDKGRPGKSGGHRASGTRQGKGGNSSSWSEQDRIAIEKRKNRFG
ncbi:SAP domain-containing protein [Histoplasma ohiense]|nr:SAP domain-containing protein [Histoplasma ohiense (nom. inval.)]